MQEGKAYLDKNLTEWKKPYLMDDNENAEKTEENAADDVEEEVETDSSPLKKPKMSKHTTMKGTAKVVGPVPNVLVHLGSDFTV